MIREVEASRLTDTVRELFITANRSLPCDVSQAIAAARRQETSLLARSVLDVLAENTKAADEMGLPICQDTGMAVVFVRLGQDVHIVGGSLNDAIQQGVAEGYRRGYLRKSVVSDPLNRVNTGDNTPAIIHLDLVPGNLIEITAVPKGFGSENMSGIRMLNPSEGRDGVVRTVLEIVNAAGSNPCPPMVVGVGIGGDFEYAALLSKKALCRPLNRPNENPFYADLETELLQKINQLGIGPQGFGGDTTALGVNVEMAPTHIAGLPVAVNIGCHVTRHQVAVI